MAFCGALDWSPDIQHHVKCQTLPLHDEDRPCVVKSHILHEVTLCQAEHGGSRGVNPDYKSVTQGVYRAEEWMATT